MSGWTATDLLPGLYVLLLAVGLALLLRRWYDPVPWRILAVFGLLLAILFGTVLFGGGVLLPLGNLVGFYPFRLLAPPDPPTVVLQGDLIHQITPWTVAVRQAFADGHWPLWNARAGAGMPLLADPQSQVLQPLVAAAYPFPIAAAVGITAALRVLVALVFSFLLLRRLHLSEAAALAGSLAFGLGGFTMLWLGWPMANCAPLLAAVLYGIVRCDREGSDEGKDARAGRDGLCGPRDPLLLYLATTALLLAGHPEVMVYSLAFAGVFLLARVRRRGRSGASRLLVRCSLAMALAGATASPVLLPAMEYLPATERAAAVLATMPQTSLGELWRELKDPKTLEQWRRRAVERLVPVVAPRAYGDFNYYWGDGNAIDDGAGFVGSAALLAALVALFPLAGRRRFPQERLAIAVLLAAVLLVAQPPGLDRLLVRLPVAGATFVHQCHRTLLLISLCLAGLAACEVDRRTRGEGSRWPVFAVAAALAVTLVWSYRAHPNPENPELLALWRNHLLAAHLATLALATALLVVKAKGGWGRAVPWLFCGLVAGELLLVHRPAVPPAPRRLAWPVTPLVRFLQENLGDARMVGLGDWAMPANFYLMYGLNDVRIDNPSIPMAYSALTWPLRRDDEPAHRFTRPRHPMYDLLGVRYVMTEPDVGLPLKLVFKDPEGWIYERAWHLPRLFLPERAVAYGGDDWADWLERNRDFAKRALVESIPGGTDWRARLPRDSVVDLATAEPEHVQARVRLAEPRLLASSIFQDGHWRVLAAGQRRPTVLVDGPFVGTWLPAGQWQVDLVYRPGLFVAGCALAALALVGAALWWVPKPRRNPCRD